MSDYISCDLCGRQIAAHASYTVNIEIYADPAMQPMTSKELVETNFDQMATELIQQMNGMTAEQLQDDVHRLFEYRVCHPCQRLLLVNPLGRPRRTHDGHN